MRAGGSARWVWCGAERRPCLVHRDGFGAAAAGAARVVAVAAKDCGQLPGAWRGPSSDPLALFITAYWPQGRTDGMSSDRTERARCRSVSQKNPRRDWAAYEWRANGSSG